MTIKRALRRFCCNALCTWRGKYSVGKLEIWSTGDIRIAAHADEKFKSCLPGFQHGVFHRGGVSGEGKDHFVGVAGADAGRHVPDDVDRGGLYGDIRHDESDRRRGSCHETESLAGYGADSFGEGGSRPGRRSECQVPGLADVALCGVV